MPFENGVRKEARHQSGCRCVICNRVRRKRELDVHSVDRSHQSGTAMVLCTAQSGSGCHTLIHKLAKEPDEVKKLSMMAANLAGLSEAYEMLRHGVPEEVIRRRLVRRPF